MARIAKLPLTIPNGVDFKIEGQVVHIKGKKGQFTHTLHPDVTISLTDNTVRFQSAIKAKHLPPMVGTTRQLVGNYVKGVHEGFERKLLLVGVGYRAKINGRVLELSLGHSHPVSHVIPEGVTIETPSNTEIVVRGADKQFVGQQAAIIRYNFRGAERYKGKGVRYSDEVIILKEVKKK